jgi:cytochrome c oxidase assembly protein subunit 15
MVQDAPPPARGHALAAGLAATVAMWAIAYVAMMRPGVIVGELLFALTLACPFVAAWFVGRDARRGAASGLLVGAVSATFNLLLVGSIIGGAEGSSVAAAARWTIGLYAVSMALGAAGAAVGRRFSARGRQRNWFHVFVRVAAAAVFLLLITGGLVTGLEAGLAVPDWPNSFGHNMLLYPLSEMTGGVYYEHAHRLYGMLVGVTTIVLVVSLFVFDDRPWLRGLGIMLLVLVCGQGLLGGLRVTGRLTLSDDPSHLAPSTALAVVHGVVGQVIFATIVLIAAFTSGRWRSREPITRAVPSAADRKGTTALVALLLVQLMLGALYRHLNAAPEVSTAAGHGLLGVHVLLAITITVLVFWVGLGAWAHRGRMPVLPRLGLILLHLVGLQLLLGGGALMAVLHRQGDPEIPVYEVAITSAHQVTGALLLAQAGLIAAWTRRLSAGGGLAA